MSRRHASNPLPRRLARAVVAALSIALVVGATLPGLASAQRDERDHSRDLEHEWQLLTYRAPGNSGNSLDPVPAGIGATLLPFGGEDAWGDGACSSYETKYSVQGTNLFIDPSEPTYVECDPASRDFDEVYYDLLWDTASFTLSGSILLLKDSIGDRLMAFTRAKIDEDPTAARWDLARIGGADGSVEPVIVGLDPWIEFLRGGSIVGSTGCGSFFGKYGTNDGTIDITDVRFRFDACTDGALAQAQKIIATLDEIAAFEVLPAGLRLQDADGTTRLALTPVIKLDARTWTPTTIYDTSGQVISEGRELSTSAVKLHAQKADGSSICRPFTARGVRSGLALNIANVKFIDKACKKPKNSNQVDQPAVEKAFIDALKATASHALRGSELEFKDVNGKTLMVLEPQAELVGPTWVVDWLGRGRTKAIGDLPLTATFTDPDDAGLVIGETGVQRSGSTNSYLADYATPQATRIDISNVEAGNYCTAKQKKTKAICKQEVTFLKLLDQADRYIARETDLKLYRGTDEIMRLVPEHLIADEG